MFIFKLEKPLFRLGQIVMTQGAAHAADEAHLLKCLSRHSQGDWGAVCDEDRQTNDDAMIEGSRILSAYPLDEAKPCKGYGENTLWIITESDRSVTTLLLPQEY